MQNEDATPAVAVESYGALERARQRRAAKDASGEIYVDGSIYEGMEACLVRSGRTIAHVVKYADAVEIAAAFSTAERASETAAPDGVEHEEDADETKRQAWSDFEDDYLCDGNDGYREASMYERCRVAFDYAYAGGPEPATAAAVAVLLAASPASPQASPTAGAGEDVPSHLRRQSWERSLAFDDAATECIRAAKTMQFAPDVPEERRRGTREGCKLLACSLRHMASRAAPDILAPSGKSSGAVGEVERLREALGPVLHWYQSDEHPERPLPEIIADVVADLQHDRAEALQAQALQRAARAAHDALIEINPNNYTHDDVCEANDAAVEAILLLADALGETHGKSPEWWADRRAALTTESIAAAQGEPIPAASQPASVEVSDTTLDRVADAIERARCPGREGPYGGYDYGYNTDFYGPEPEDGRYVVRDFRDPASPDWGKWVHQTHDQDKHEAAFRRLTGRHIARAALSASQADTDGEGR